MDALKTRIDLGSLNNQFAAGCSAAGVSIRPWQRGVLITGPRSTAAAASICAKFGALLSAAQRSRHSRV